MPYISVVIASYNRKHITIESVNSVLSQDYPKEKFELILVDNNSHDGTSEAIEKYFPEDIQAKRLKLMSLKYNSGSSGSYIECLKVANPKWSYLLKMDEDVVLDSNCLKNLVRVAVEDTNITIVGGKVLYKQNPNIIQAIGSKLSPIYSIAKGIGINSKDSSGQFNSPLDMQGVNGCMMLISRKIYEEVGWFDNDYFLYYDDHDLMFKSLKSGFIHKYTPKAIGFHDTSTGNKKKYSNKLWLYYSSRGSILFMNKNFSIFSISYWLFFISHNIKFVLGLIFILIKSHYSNWYENLKNFFMGYYHGVIGKSGFYDVHSNSLNIVIFSGGRGSTSISSALRDEAKKKKKNFFITHITNAYDDGKSTGEIRSLYNNSILGPSDLRKIQANQFDALYQDEYVSRFFSFRFKNSFEEVNNFLIEVTNNSLSDINPLSSFYPFLLPSLKEIIVDATKYFLSTPNIETLDYSDFAFSNIVYGSLAAKNRGLEFAEILIRKAISLPDKVLLNSNENLYLTGLTESGRVLANEAEIVDYEEMYPIYDIFFSKKPLPASQLNQINEATSFEERKHKMKQLSCENPTINSDALSAIYKADIIIYSPGTQYSSLYPTYLTQGLNTAIKSSNAFKVFITNILHDNETPGFNAVDQVKQACFYLQNREKNIKENEFIDMLIANIPSDDISTYINLNRTQLERLDIQNVILDDVEDRNLNKKGIHSGQKITRIILDFFNNSWN